MRLSGNAAPPSTGSCSRPCWNASTEQTPISPPWMPTLKRFWPPFADTVARLDEIPGVGPVAAAAILAEPGLDMSRVPTPEHLTSWATFAPGIKASAGKIKGNGATGHGNPHLARTLGDLAIGAARTNTFDSAQRTDVRRTGRWWPRGWTRGALASSRCGGRYAIARVSRLRIADGRLRVEGGGQPRSHGRGQEHG